MWFMRIQTSDRPLTPPGFSLDPKVAQLFQLATTLSDQKLTQVLELGLKQSRVKDPHNPAPLQALGLLYRRRGNLEMAQQIYNQWQQLKPEDSMVTYLRAIFNQQPLPYFKPPHTFMPTPFVWIQDFLSLEQNQALLQFALQHQSTFEWASLGHNERLDYDKRQNLVLNELGDLSQQFKQLILAQLPNLLLRLNLGQFELSLSEVKMTNYLHNSFFIYHSDGIYTTAADSQRLLSFIYYFYQEPKSFQGGDLLLCDTLIIPKSAIDREYEYQVENFTRIMPTNNCLVVFPSDYVHAVTPVQLQAQDFQYGRLAISGHIHKAI